MTSERRTLVESPITIPSSRLCMWYPSEKCNVAAPTQFWPRSNRPRLQIAGSTTSGLFVAQITHKHLSGFVIPSFANKRPSKFIHQLSNIISIISARICRQRTGTSAYLNSYGRPGLEPSRRMAMALSCWFAERSHFAYIIQ